MSMQITRDITAISETNINERSNLAQIQLPSIIFHTQIL